MRTCLLFLYKNSRADRFGLNAPLLVTNPCQGVLNRSSPLLSVRSYVRLSPNEVSEWF